MMKKVVLSLFISFLISTMLLFWIPARLGESILRGTAVGDTFTVFAYYPWSFSFECLGIQNFYFGVVIGIGVWFLIYYTPVFLMILKKFKNKPIEASHVFFTILAMIGMVGFLEILTVVLAPQKDDNPDIRASVLDKLRPGMELEEVRAFIPKPLYTRRFRPTPILNIVDGLAHDEHMDPNKVFLSPEIGESRFQLELFADGKNFDYRAKIYFTEDYRMCGVYYDFGFAKYYSFESNKADWKPTWKFVRYSQLLLQSHQVENDE